MKQLIATTVLLTLIGCASAQDCNRSDNILYETYEYTPEQRSADFFFELLGLGPLYKQAIETRMRIQSHERDMAKRERERVSEIAIRQIVSILVAIDNPNSLYFKDATHLNALFVRSEEARAYLGGSFEAKPTGKKHEEDEIYSVRIFNPLTNEDIMTFNETAKGIIAWFYAHVSASIHSDATGKPFEWKTRDGQTSYSNEVKPDAYGIGDRFNTNQRNQQQGFGNSWDNKNIYMQPYEHNAYGPGIHSDSTGKPFEWKTQDGQKSRSKVKPDAYGLGVGMDEYGRPVKPSPWPSPLPNPYPNPYPNPFPNPWGQQ
jgi:hypothetical protein